MSEADRQGTTVTADGVAVEKSHEFDQFPVPAVTLVVRSLREETVTVRLSDPLPEAVSMTDVGLHSDYGEEYATVADGQVRLEFGLAPDETVTVVYGLRNVDPADLADGPLDPGVAAAATGTADGSDTSEAVREVISGEDDAEAAADPIDLADPTGTGESPPGDATADASPAGDSSGSEATGDEPAADPPDTADEPQEDGSVPDDSDGSAGADVPDGTDAGEDPAGSGVPDDAAGDADTSRVAAALAREIDSGEADESDVAVLREALDVEAGGSTEARLRDLQSEVADLRAYTDALEAFLDEQGTARTLLRTLKDDVDRLEADLADTGDRLDGHDDALSSAEADLAAAQEAVETVESGVESVEETVVAMEDDLGATRKRLADLEDRVDDLAATVETHDEDLAAIGTDGPADVADRLSAVEERVESLADDLEQVAGIQTRLQSVFAEQTADEE